jgi:transcription elongation GreA/GreB family factor
MESLSLTRRQRRPGVLLAFCEARERGALGDNAEQRQAIDTLQILRVGFA